jgi:hypothetical protein
MTSSEMYAARAKLGELVGLRAPAPCLRAGPGASPVWARSWGLCAGLRARNHVDQRACVRVRPDVAQRMPAAGWCPRGRLTAPPLLCRFRLVEQEGRGRGRLRGRAASALPGVGMSAGGKARTVVAAAPRRARHQSAELLDAFLAHSRALPTLRSRRRSWRLDPSGAAARRKCSAHSRSEWLHFAESPRYHQRPQIEQSRRSAHPSPPSVRMWSIAAASSSLESARLSAARESP